MIKNFIFDIDGTLLDSQKLTFESIEYALKKVGQSLSGKDWEYFYQFGIEALIKVRQIPQYKILFALYFFQRYKLEHLQDLHLYPEIAKVLNNLYRQKKLLGIISSNSLKIIDGVLSNTNMNHFSFAYSAGFLDKERALQKVLKKYQLLASETVYIGDEIHDIEAPKRLGIRSAAVTWGFNSREALSKSHPDYIINYPQDILKIK